MVAKRGNRSAAAKERRVQRGHEKRLRAAPRSEGQSAGGSATGPKLSTAGGSASQERGESAVSPAIRQERYFVWGKRYLDREAFDQEIDKDI